MAKRDKPEARNALYSRYEAVIGRVVEHYLHKLNLPDWADHDSIRQAGHIGALDAMKRYDPQRGSKFTSFMVLRIRGAMIDEMRNQDTVSRLARRMVSERITAEQVLQEEGKMPSPEEVCEKLGWDRKTYLLSTARAQASLDHLASRRRREHNRQDTAADMWLRIRGTRS